MSYQRVSIDEMADVIMEELNKFNETGIDEVKKAVKKGGKIVKDDINASAPVRTGRYAKSWTYKVTAEDSASIEENVISDRFDKKEFNNGPLFNMKAIHAESQRLVEEYQDDLVRMEPGDE